jgi:hypothetical protein
MDNLQEPRLPGVISVQKGDQFTLGLGYAPIAGSAHPLVLLSYKAKEGRVKGLDDLPAAIGGPIIDHDNFIG